MHYFLSSVRLMFAVYIALAALSSGRPINFNPDDSFNLILARENLLTESHKAAIVPPCVPRDSSSSSSCESGSSKSSSSSDDSMPTASASKSASDDEDTSSKSSSDEGQSSSMSSNSHEETSTSAADDAKPTSDSPTGTTSAGESKETSSDTASPSSSATPNADEPIVGTYYTDWTGSQFPPSSIDFDKFNLILYYEQGNLVFEDDSSKTLLKDVVDAAHGKSKKTVLTIGGWTGSKYFSQIVGTDSGRQQFASNIKSTIDEYNLDGIDIDWEYPGSNNGNAGNIVSPKDSQNLLETLKAIRTSIGQDKTISMATAVLPFVGDSGSPMTDVSAFAEVLDFITIMNYDINQASPNPGPNAPLKSCGGDPNLSGQGALDAWTKAKFPANQLVLGVPYYGYVSDSPATSFTTSEEDDSFVNENTEEKRAMSAGEFEFITRPMSHQQLYEQGWAAVRAARAAQSGNSGASPSGNSGTSQSGSSATTQSGTSSLLRRAGDGNLEQYKGAQATFRQIVEAGALTEDESGNFAAGGGFTRGYDDCSQTPFLSNPSSNTFVSYDDPESLQAKSKFVVDNGMAGVNSWSMDGDTDDHALVSATRTGLGL